MKNYLFLEEFSFIDGLYAGYESAEKNSVQEILAASAPAVHLSRRRPEKGSEVYEYRPKHVRGSGVLREGYCSRCNKWYKLKTSSYWYHMNYKHGINSSGVKYPDPVVRVLGDRNEAFCSLCNKWVALGRGKSSYKFNWYRHWQKIHVVDQKNKKCE